MDFKNTIPGIIILGVISSLIATYIDKQRHPSEAPTTTPPPVITAFVAKPQSIDFGATTQLRWEVTGAPEVTIEPGIGKVGPVSTIEVKPERSTTYTLTASGPGGTVSGQAAIAVVAPPTPAPPEFPNPQPTNPPQSPKQDDTSNVSRVSKFWSPVSVPLIHWHRIGEKPLGTFEISPTGISWILAGHREESFQDRPCSALKSLNTDTIKSTIDLRIDLETKPDQKFTFKADSASTIDKVDTALYALCDSPVMKKRGVSTYEAEPARGESYYFNPGKVELYSQDQGDFIVFQFETPLSWNAALIVDVNQNDTIDPGDVQYGNRGSAPYDCIYAPGASDSCNEFRSSGTIKVEQHERPSEELGYPFRILSAGMDEEPVISVTRLIPKSELTAAGPFVSVLLRLYNAKTKQDGRASFIKIPFAMTSEADRVRNYR